jgi:RNA polymerase sigma-70 factor (ECF subfamily)
LKRDGPDADARRALLVDDLAAVSRGDRSALARLYSATSAKLFGVCLRICGERELAEEALQETYLTVWTKAHQFDPARASPITWLVAVARNKALDRLRARPRPAAPLEEAETEPDLAPLPSDTLEASDEHRRLARCLDGLDANHARMVRIAFFNGVTYQELAQRESVPLGTMKSWIRRSLLSLRSCLDR